MLLSACAGFALRFLTMWFADHTIRTRLSIVGICSALAIGLAALASRLLSGPTRELIARLDHSRQQFDHTCFEFVETMAQALEARDPYTAGHSNRVRDYALAIARAMRLPPEEIELIRVGAQLHDIGKIGVPDAVLQKPGYLTTEEYELIKLHPQIGKRILERVGLFEKYLPVVALHHEDYDGGGYPYGLKGLDVPLAVRIVHVADVYDALTSNRAYRDAMPLQTAQEIIEISAGTQFDPEVGRVFSAILNLQELARRTDLARLADLVRN
jgi:putative nucleotidyltransferase with HDIG domain